MSTHNICFCREIRKILCGCPLLSVAMRSTKYHQILLLMKFSKLEKKTTTKKLEIQDKNASYFAHKLSTNEQTQPKIGEGIQDIFLNKNSHNF